MTDANDWNRPLETGLRDDFDATIVNSFFGTDARYNNGETMLLKWEIQGLDNEDVAFEDTLLITVGKGWETVDGGATVRHSSGKDKYFNNNSHYGMLIARAIGELGIGEILQQRGNPFQAKTWEGLSFHFERELKSYGTKERRNDAGEIIPNTSEKMMVTKFNGVGAATGVTQSQPAASGTATGTAPVEVNAEAEAAKLRIRLTAIAKESESNAVFVDKAMEVAGVLTDKTLMDEIMTGAFFTGASA